MELLLILIHFSGIHTAANLLGPAVPSGKRIRQIGSLHREISGYTPVMESKEPELEPLLML